ncbi:exodeoxyribonuclease V subunit beta [Candidatus Gillettellia adelgis]
MTERVPRRLNPCTLPLFGERLIEASAGTGKTFMIGVIYLRLLLGLGKDTAFLRPLTVAEILVVTFTEATTEELRKRIRNNIYEFRLACMRGKSQEPVFSILLHEINNLSVAVSHLLLAEQQMDIAAIYTIHGFCQKVLLRNAFEFGILFEQTLVQDEFPLRQQACTDFWRRYCYQLPLNIARIIIREWSGPAALLADIADYLHSTAPVLYKPPKDTETVMLRHKRIVSQINAIKTSWQKFTDTLQTLINQSGIDKRSYSNKHLSNWLKKIDNWAMQETLDYTLPKELNNFRQSILLKKTQQGEIPRHALFTAIDELFSTPLTLRDLVIAHALSEVRYSIQQKKRQRAECGFDDLLNQMDIALQSTAGKKLAQAIRQDYPVAIIDEFQDTDPLQYRIFQKLYVGQPHCGLLLIGDPKQAIYAFRGADIFTYMRARSELNAHYTLDTNWRSSPAMIASVNTLFGQLKQPFIFSQIPFTKVSATKKNQAMIFELQNTSQPAIQFWLQPGAGVSVNDYQNLTAKVCASQICKWLNAGQEGQAWLHSSKKCRKPVQASNITVLVRNRNEAAIVRNALSAVSIPSVYLSNHTSIFDTSEAKDLLWLLRAVLAPKEAHTLRSAMATRLIGLDTLTLANINENKIAWDGIVRQFDTYRTFWEKFGILPMLHEVIKEHHIPEKMLSDPDGNQRLTNVLHLGELLQEASAQFDSAPVLVRWMTKQITQPNLASDNHQLRLNSDQHCIKVITIHKSKGLEFDLIWLPFISNFRKKPQALYHDRYTFQALLDLNINKEHLVLSEEERLAEDMRLLYVALTRSVYHSSIGIAPLIHGTRKKRGVTDLHHSALGYLVQRGKAGDAVYLHKRLQTLATGNIMLSQIAMINQHTWQPQKTNSQKLAARYFTRPIEDCWRVTSYTDLQRCSKDISRDLPLEFNLDSMHEQTEKEKHALTQHTFPIGRTPGTFLHNILETLDFTKPLNEHWLLKKLKKEGFSEQWTSVLHTWIQTLLTSSLNRNSMTLSVLKPRHKQTEFQFYLPINTFLHAHTLDALIKKYDPLSARCPALDFQKVTGMLKGFIDLVFLWKGQYYLLDYKSNWLGEDSRAYTLSAMENAIMEHRYDLQYQLYTLALHRYLRHRLTIYDYQQHFGGIIYLFLRGIDTLHPGNGIFTYCPSQKLVEGMDFLFSVDASVRKNK